jgi:hypothetical protein
MLKPYLEASRWSVRTSQLELDPVDDVRLAMALRDRPER